MNIVFQSVTSSFDNFLVVHFIERYKPYWTLSIVLLKCGTEMTAWSFEMNPEIRWLSHCFSAVIFFHEERVLSARNLTVTGSEFLLKRKDMRLDLKYFELNKRL